MPAENLAYRENTSEHTSEPIDTRKLQALIYAAMVAVQMMIYPMINKIDGSSLAAQQHKSTDGRHGKKSPKSLPIEEKLKNDGFTLTGFTENLSTYKQIQIWKKETGPEEDDAYVILIIPKGGSLIEQLTFIDTAYDDDGIIMTFKNKIGAAFTLQKGNNSNSYQLSDPNKRSYPIPASVDSHSDSQ